MPALIQQTILCAYCGYDLRGNAGARTCPECGRRQRRHRRRRRGPHAEFTLDRESYGVILSCLWRALLALASFALVALAMVLGPIHGGEVLIWSLAVVPFPLAISTIMRTSSALVPPAKREIPQYKHVRQAIRIAGLCLLAVGAVTVVLAASGGSGPASLGNTTFFSILLGACILSVVIAMAGIWSAVALDQWALDDRAARLHELSMWMIVLVSILAPTLLFFLASFTGSGTRPIGVVFIGMVGWWLLVVLGDVSVIASAVWCLWHRMHYDEIDARQNERDRRDSEEVRRRVKAMDHPPPK